MELLKRIAQNVINGNDEQVAELTALAIEENTSSKCILDDGLLAGMAVVGQRFKVHDIFLPDVLMAAKAMYAGMDVLKPLLIKDGVPPIGKVVLGTIQGDLHDIGKNLVAIMLKGAGFEIIDLGNDVAPQRFVDAAIEQGATVIGMSALLTTTMAKMRDVVELLEQQKLTSKIKTIVGGAPVSEDFVREIGADAYGFDAANAVDQVKSLIGEN